MSNLESENTVIQLRKRLQELLAATGTNVNRISQGNLSRQRKLHRQINEDVAITADTLLYMLDAFPGLSSAWLLEGKGSVFTAESGVACDRIETGRVRRIGDRFVELVEDDTVIPVYSVEASANLDTLQVGEESSDQIVGMVHVPNVPRCDGATYVRGDSMFPLLQSGDMIGFKTMPVSRDSIFFGEMYLIWLDVEGDRYLTVKYIQPSDLGDEYVMLESANPNYRSKSTHLSSIKMLALVKFTVRMNSMY